MAQYRTQSSSVACSLKFAPPEEFHYELRRRIDAHFDRTRQNKRDCPGMYVKSAVVLCWCAVSYTLLVGGGVGPWLAFPLLISLGLSMAAIGFCIQHDGGHQAYSEHKWINRLAALTLDLLGSSSYVWARKHNAIHHCFANITGQDDDINLGFLGRLSPHQPRLWFHRMQHVYLWFLYGFLSIKWQVYDDFHEVLLGRIGDRPIARPTGWNALTLIGGKVVFFVLAFVIPLQFHPLWVVLAGYFVASFVAGLVLSVVFQLAHCVEEAEFPSPPEGTHRMPTDWAAHQIQTTVDFARGSRMLSWFTGGLNFQIEHHLFPQICHIHYPAIAPLVEQTCREYGLRYRVHRTLFAGLGSHFRWLRRMGSEVVIAESMTGRPAQEAQHALVPGTGFTA